MTWLHFVGAIALMAITTALLMNAPRPRLPHGGGPGGTPRQRMEHSLVGAILHRDAIHSAEGRSYNFAYIEGEANGLCVALRQMGGYGGVTFDSAWANAHPSAAYWDGFEQYAAASTP